MLSCPFFQCSRTSATTHFLGAWPGRWVRGISPRNQLTTLAQHWCLKFGCWLALFVGFAGYYLVIDYILRGLPPRHLLHHPRLLLHLPRGGQGLLGGGDQLAAVRCVRGSLGT
jgi:hypothetical protein